MSLTKRIGRVFIEILFLPIHLLVWYFSLAFAVLFVGMKWFSFYISGEGPGVEVNVPPMSLLFKTNKNYGSVSVHSYTPTTSSSIFNNAGVKVGTITTKGETETWLDTDDRDYVPRYLLVLLYMLYFPINRIFVILLSIIAIFTDKFYVSGKIPDDYDPSKYSRALYTWFNIIYERNHA